MMDNIKPEYHKNSPLEAETLDAAASIRGAQSKENKQKPKLPCDEITPDQDTLPESHQTLSVNSMQVEDGS